MRARDVSLKLVVNKLTEHGYTLARTKGDHHIMSCPGRKPAVIPYRGHQMDRNMLCRIEKQIGIKLEL
jgi:predicted RNA binding protein YcfA (HicA-like mRNA interferase family)